MIGMPKTKSVPSFGQVQKIAVQDINEELKKQMSARDEDIKSMLELQCLVIEDLLTKQMVFSKPEASFTPDRSRQEDFNESKGKRNKSQTMGKQQSFKK